MEAIARSLLDRIEDPEDPALRQLQADAIEHAEGVLADSSLPSRSEIARRLSYTYYYDWETDDPDYMLLVQDPGNLHQRHLAELEPTNPLAGDCTYRDQIQVYREFGKSWLTGRNADFSERFFRTLADHDLISIDGDWQSYIQSGQMYRDFYLGDVVKYRVDGFGRTAERRSYDAFLAQEIEALDPELLITFGGNAWDALRRETNPKAVTGDQADPDRMMDIHGSLRSIDTPSDTFVLPLSHMSGQVWWRFPPDEYIERLSSALATWQRRR